MAGAALGGSKEWLLDGMGRLLSDNFTRAGTGIRRALNDGHGRHAGSLAADHRHFAGGRTLNNLRQKRRVMLPTGPWRPSPGGPGGRNKVPRHHHGHP